MIKRTANLKIIDAVGKSDLATVYIAKTSSGKSLEFVESLPTNLGRQDRWVLIVSVLFGCPVACKMCDAGSYFEGKLTKEEIFAQIDYMVDLYYPERIIDSREFKIQFARMGEPALNQELLNVLEELPDRYQANGLLPSISTVAPLGRDHFFSELLKIKDTLYHSGKFQMQFSIHTTDSRLRDEMIPVDKWNFAKIADYGSRFYVANDQKIVLNFALTKDAPIDIAVLKKYFSPDLFIVKITPVNPTVAAINNNLDSYFVTGSSKEDTSNLIFRLKDAGYEVILSIGDLEENKIGSNCGQYIRKFAMNMDISSLMDAYGYFNHEHTEE